MNTELEKTMAVIAGKSRTAFDISRVTDTDRREIEYALEMLFGGLSLQEWMKGGKLIDAWRAANAQMRKMVFEITDINPVVLFTRNAVFNPDSK